jgi:hypothetical protein
VCTFTVGAGAPTTVTTATTLDGVFSFNADNLVPHTQIHEGTLTIP